MVELAKKSDIPSVPSVPSVINNLTSTSTTDALSANQGKVLKGLIDGISTGSGYTDLTFILYQTVTSASTKINLRPNYNMLILVHGTVTTSSSYYGSFHLTPTDGSSSATEEFTMYYNINNSTYTAFNAWAIVTIFGNSLSIIGPSLKNRNLDKTVFSIVTTSYTSSRYLEISQSRISSFTLKTYLISM